VNKTINVGKLDVSAPGWLSRYSDSLRTERSGDPVTVGIDIPHPFRLALKLTQPRIKCVPGLFPGVKAVGAWR
jgi:hypothetical protein